MNAVPTVTAATRLQLQPVLTATGIEKSFRRGTWPQRHRIPVLRGIDL
ncbi:hypothetical protein [Streptomyces sp. NPDC001401]